MFFSHFVLKLTIQWVLVLVLVVQSHFICLVQHRTANSDGWKVELTDVFMTVNCRVWIGVETSYRPLYKINVKCKRPEQDQNPYQLEISYSWSNNSFDSVKRGVASKVLEGDALLGLFSVLSVSGHYPCSVY